MKIAADDALTAKVANTSILLIAGIALGRLIDLYNYFYDIKEREGYFLIAVLLFIVVARRYSNTSFRFGNTYNYLNGLLIIFVASFGPKIIYFSSGHNDWSGLLSMIFTTIMAFIIPLKKESKTSYFYDVPWLLLGVVISFLIDSILLVYVLAPISLILLTYHYQKILTSSKWAFSLLAIICIGVFCSFSLPNVQKFDSQQKFFDKVVFSHKTRLQQIDITSWKGHYWYYYNKIKYLSSVDQWMYFEPLVHPVMHLTVNAKRVLVIGGENGCSVRELAKYPDIQIDQAPFDTELMDLAKDHPLFHKVNDDIYHKSEITIINKEIFNFLANNQSTYDVIIVDLPDPTDIEVNQYYTVEFYDLCAKALKPNGMMSTQAGSPYFAAKAFLSVNNTMQAADLNTIMMHNQIPSLGEWGWIIGLKDNPKKVKTIIQEMDFSDIQTTWLDKNALNILFSFGKTTVTVEDIGINSLKNPITHRLYKEGDLKIE